MTLTALLASTTLLLSALGVGSASAQSAQPDQTLVVDDNRAQCPDAGYVDIQSAVDAAERGARIIVCPGRYSDTDDPDHHGVRITAGKDELHLLANGAEDEVVIDGDPGGERPIPEHGIVLENVRGVLVEGFSVVNFNDNIFLTGSDANTIRRNVVKGPSGHAGIHVVEGSDGNRIEHNVATDNGDPATGCGIDIETNSSHNVVRFNSVSGNDRAGIRLRSAGPGNRVADNVADRNGRNGILNEASHSSLLVSNRASHNRHEGPTELDKGAGIRVLASSGVRVRRNSAFNSSFFDIFWDQSGNNRFAGNRCLSSSPASICRSR